MHLDPPYGAMGLLNFFRTEKITRGYLFFMKLGGGVSYEARGGGTPAKLFKNKNKNKNTFLDFSRNMFNLNQFFIYFLFML